MQQRVGLVRALPSDAGILLMDVAFSSLGPLIRTNMQDMLLALQEELNKTIVFITHDINEVLKIGAKSITPSWVIKIMEKEGFSDLYNETLIAGMTKVLWALRFNLYEIFFDKLMHI
jgi:ABC-type nitrate/sulfonate/bicarbonate transport system ATPase subunit